MNDKRKMQLTVVIVVMVSLGLLFFLPTLLPVGPFSAITSNWEIASGTSRIAINGEPYDISSDMPFSQDYVGTYKSVIKIDDSGYEEEVNKRYGGTTAIQVALSNPVHMTRSEYGNTWYPVGDETPFRTYTKTVGNKIYKYRHDVWTVDIEIRTDGAVKPWGIDYIGTCEGLPEGLVVNPVNHHADVRVFFGFIVQPWDINVGDEITEGDATYEIEGSWTGIMSASIMELVGAGAVPGGASNPTYFGEVDVRNTVGSAINMYDLEGWPTGLGLGGEEADEQPLSSISGVPTTVMLEVNAKLQPGLAIVKDSFGSWASATPVDNYVTYRVRIDTVGEYDATLISGVQPTMTQPTNPEPPPDIPNIWDVFAGLGS